MLKLPLKYQFLLAAVLFFMKLRAQDTIVPFGVKTTYHYGFILPHREVVNEIIEGHTEVIEVSLFKNVLPDKQWDSFYNSPKIGISILYFDLSNPTQLGKSIGFYPYFSFTKGKGRIKWENKFGAGMGYIEKPYNRKTNYQNLVIGSKFNALISANTQLHIKINNQLNTTVGLSLLHFSNAAFTVPNLGINIVSLNVGMAYHFGEDVIIPSKEIEERKRIWSKNVVVGFGVKEIFPVEGPKYAVITSSFNMMKIRSNKSSFGAGFDLFYNSSLSAFLANDEAYEVNNADNVRAGVTLIYSLDFGRFSTLIQLGGYLYNKETEKGLIYNRFMMRYYTNKKVFFNLGLKTHMAVADYLEAGVGVKFN